MQDLQTKVQTSGRKYRVGIVGAGSIGCFDQRLILRSR